MRCSPVFLQGRRVPMLYIKKMTLPEAEKLVSVGALVRLRSYKKGECPMSFLSNGFIDLDVIEIEDGDMIRRYKPV